MDEVLAPDPAAPTLRTQALAHLQAQRWGPAQALLESLLTLEPANAWALQWLVVVAMALRQPQQAIARAQAALAVWPQNAPPEAAADLASARADLLFNLGQAHGLLGQFTQALQAYDEVLRLRPGDADALQGRAQALAQLGEHGQAGKAVTAALMADPHNLHALALLANSLLKAGAIDKALSAFVHHEQQQPAAPYIACMVVYLARALADWRWPGLRVTPDEGRLLQAAEAQGRRPELDLLAHRARQGQPAIEPFASLVLYDDPALQRHVAGQFLQQQHPPAAQAPAWPHPPWQSLRNAGPLKLAYVSCDFNEHATSHLLTGVLARHRRQRVQVYLLNWAPAPGDGPNAMQQRLMQMGHTWVDIHGWSDAQVAQWCRDEGIGVAVDLQGLAPGHRMGIFAQRAAPVQVSWLGYPGTLPAPYIDWVLADAQVLPPDLEPHFAERVWRLPHCYQPHDPDPSVDPGPQRRADHGLPDSGLVLACMGKPVKITPEVWAVWMRLLRLRSDAVLWLLAGPDKAQQHLRAHAQQAGVDPQRLVFAPRLPQARHLARLALADLSLDTLPCNARTSASDALWAGVPHVSCSGRSFAARVGASVLTAAGLPELITQSLSAYEALLHTLCTQDRTREALRERLRAQRSTAPLWQTERFVHQLEEAFTAMANAHALRPRPSV